MKIRAYLASLLLLVAGCLTTSTAPADMQQMPPAETASSSANVAVFIVLGIAVLVVIGLLSAGLKESKRKKKAGKRR